MGGHPQAITPNLDRLVRTSRKCSGFFATSTWKMKRRERYTPVRLALANSGVLFTNAHCPAAVRFPSHITTRPGVIRCTVFAAA